MIEPRHCPDCQRTLASPEFAACPRCRAPMPPMGWPTDAMLGQSLDERRLTLLERVGVGGFGVVYRARHEPSQEPRAVKLLGEQHGLDPQLQALFLQEARVLQRLSHPNIVACDGLGITPEGRAWLSLEFLRGRSVEAELKHKQGAPFSPARVVRLGIQLASALACAHAAPLLHRDLKPGNVMLVAGPDGQEQAKIIDFGLSKVLGRQPTDRKTSRVAGTPEFMAPEQFRPGTLLDERLDLWQLGATLHAMLTGHPPYQTQSLQDLLKLQQGWLRQAEQRTPGPRPSARGVELPAPLDELVSALLSPSPDARPRSAAEVEARLRAMTDDAVALEDPGELGSEDAAPPSYDSTLDQPAINLQNMAHLCPACQAHAPGARDPRCAACGELRPASGWPLDPLSGIVMAHKRYRLLRRVARGRLGPIYRATDQAQDRAVLVRVISPTDSKEAMQAWALRALPPLQGLSHPALAGLWDVGVIAGEGSPFVVLEPVEGVSLERAVWPEGYRFPRLMDPFVVVQVATQLATALAQLHAQGWAHGGVTPSNLFVAAGQGGAAQVKLLGLGNAQLRALARACGLRVASGDPRFAAPEPLATLQVGDARADLFQLGAVMHFMLTGWPPYPCDERDPRHMPTSEQVLGVLRGWPAGPGPRPSQWVPALKVFEGLDELVAELLAPRAQERPGDAYAVAVRLSEVLQARRPARALAMAKTQELEPVGAAPDPALTNP